MIISINHQVKLLVFSLASGMITGVLFDIYRIIRGLENPNRVITFIEDTLFWILTGILVFVFLLYTNYAYVGFYVYLFIAIGIYLYMKLISDFFIAIQYGFLKSLGKFLRILKNNLIFPIEVIIYKIRRKK
ncbi:Spore protein YabQ [Clostridium liquoris]|jgi:spore cortex biosynthesis protein YabQ|uniref:Spore protein YabQ n=1 Tax=Clostridium liquoris TaxID=1289519 RepID=A0A2T0B0V6_9CLOT|nr:spore cortex biosynthesis protein YabQ [Clostridium liquoris]PRR77196.1 Spore protein YabQ [Clostridium liquoris]